MGRSIAVVCPKGGVGKTTVSVNLLAAFAEKGYRCLLVGVDPQCGLIGSFGRDRFDIDNGLFDYFDPEGSPEDAVQFSGTPNLDFITSNIWSSEEERLLLERAAADPLRLRAAIAPLRGLYDLICFDCPPNLGPLTTAALLASDGYLVPVQAEELAYLALPRLFDSIDETRWEAGGPPELLGVLLNQVDQRTRLTNSVVERVRGKYGKRVFETMIPRTVRLAEVAMRGKPVNRFNRVGRAARAFAALADELFGSLIGGGQGGDETALACANSAELSLPRETLMAPPLPTDITRSKSEPKREEGSGQYLPDGDRILSLDEIPEPELIGGRIRTQPNLDDYDYDGEGDS